VRAHVLNGRWGHVESKNPNTGKEGPKGKSKRQKGRTEYLDQATSCRGGTAGAANTKKTLGGDEAKLEPTGGNPLGKRKKN